MVAKPSFQGRCFLSLSLVLLCVLYGSFHLLGAFKNISNTPFLQNFVRVITVNNSEIIQDTCSCTGSARNYVFAVDGEPDKCQTKLVKLSPVPLPLTGLISFPGSGNTWTRHLIQQMTGLGTSSVYCDKSLKLNGFPYECHEDKQQTVVVKTHHAAHLKQFSKVVLLIRNPYDAFLSYTKYRVAGHTDNPSHKAMKKAASDQFKNSLGWYTGVVRGMVEQFRGPVYLLQYERLKTDMAAELLQLAGFLNIHVTQQDVECTVRLQEGNFHRKSNVSNIELLRECYNMQQLENIRDAEITVQKMLKQAYNRDIMIEKELEEKLFLNKSLEKSMEPNTTARHKRGYE